MKKMTMMALLMIAGSFNNAFAVEKTVALDHVVAIINQEVITESQIKAELADLQAMLAMQKAQHPNAEIPVPTEAQMRDQALQRLISRSLQVQYAQKMKLQISDEMVDQAIADIAKQNKMDMAQFSDALGKEGMTLKEYRNKIRQQLLERELKQKIIVPNVQVNAEEVQAALQDAANPANQRQQFLVRDYLVETNDDADPATKTAAKEQAERVLKSVKAGSSPSTQEAQMIDLGWRRAHELPDVFVTALNKMQKGESQGPLLTANGYHVLQLVDVKSAYQDQTLSEYQVRHILMKPTAIFNDKLVKEQLTKIKREVDKGVDFAKLARKYSEDFATAPKGGLMGGWLKASQLPADFAQQLQKMNKGQMSAPFKSDDGWHLLYLENVRSQEDGQALREQETRNWVFMKKVQVEHEKWLAKLKESTFIKIEHA